MDNSRESYVDLTTMKMVETVASVRNVIHDTVWYQFDIDKEDVNSCNKVGANVPIYNVPLKTVFGEAYDKACLLRLDKSVILTLISNTSGMGESLDEGELMLNQKVVVDLQQPENSNKDVCLTFSPMSGYPPSLIISPIYTCRIPYVHVHMIVPAILLLVYYVWMGRRSWSEKLIHWLVENIFPYLNT